MSWVKIDDGFDDDRDVSRLSHGAFRLFTCALPWSRRHQTGGFLTRDDVEDIARRQRIHSIDKIVEELLTPNPDDPVAEALWVRDGTGFRIRTYPKFNPLTSTERMREKRSRDAHVTKESVTSDAPVTSQPRHNLVTRDVTVTKNGVTSDAHVTPLARASATGLAHTRQVERLPVPEPVPDFFSPPATPPPSDGDAGPVLDVLRRVSGKPPSGANVRTIDGWLTEFQNATPSQIAGWLEDAWSYRAQPPDKLELLTKSIRVRYASWRDDQLKARTG